MKRRLLAAALTLGAMVGAATASADIIVVNDTLTVRQPSIETPARGMSMDRVEAKFGAPAQRHAAVGQPAITRWDYPGFSVFFENQLVIHSVASGA